MRISKEEIYLIRTTILKFAIYSEPVKIYLFGSRTDSVKRGGDIDLLIIISDKDFQSLAAKKHYLLAEIKTLIGDQKIDITIISKNKISTDEFYQSIKESLVEI